MQNKLSSSPHIRSDASVKRIMLDVIIALAPALVFGVITSGLRALFVTVIAVIAALLGEFLAAAVKKEKSAGDLSAIVTGLLSAMILPASVPYYVAAIGAFFAAFAVKGLGGGLGKNIFNPALAGRALLMLLFPSALVRFSEYGAKLPLSNTVDFVSSATPLHYMQMPAVPETTLTQMLLGQHGGCIGETASLLLLLGGAYLVWRKVISLRIPAAYLGTVAVLTLLFSKSGSAFTWMLYSILGGGVLLGAIFMATDYCTSPVRPEGQVIFGIGCGILTVAFRYYGLFPESVTYSILLMNAFTPVIDRYLPAHRFGTDYTFCRKFYEPACVIAVCVLILCGVGYVTKKAEEQKKAEYISQMVSALLGGAADFAEEPYEGEDANIVRVYRSSGGAVVETVTTGYNGEIRTLVGVDNSGTVTGIMITGMEETPGLGQRAANDTAFLSQFAGKSGPFTIGDNVDAMSGATVTSKAIAKALTSASAFMSGADVVTSASTWGE